MFTFTLRLGVEFLCFVFTLCLIVMQDNMCQTMSISSGVYPQLHLWNADKLHCAELPAGRRNYSKRVLRSGS